MTKKAQFLNAHFLRSAFKAEQFPHIPAHRGGALPEIAIVGRSNVGKSSLLNHLLNKKGLAKISSSPGKTRCINFFIIDECLALVDLPGYGYASRSKKEINQWSTVIEDYLRERSSLQLILFLLDIRRDPSSEDLAFLQWAVHYNKPLLIVFTKCDLISEGAKNGKTAKILDSLYEGINNPLGNSIIAGHSEYSIKNPKSRKQLIHLLQDRIYGAN